MRLVDFLTDSTVVFFIANTLYVISYMLTSMFWLRVLAVVAAVSTFPYFYFQVEPLWSALFWPSCFLAVNLVNLMILLYSMRSANFDALEELAYKIKFSGLKPHEVRPIFKHSQRQSLAKEETLLSDGEKNEALYLILAGACKVTKDDQEIAILEPGQFVGELSFLSGDEISADVVAMLDTELMLWDKTTLEPLFKRQGLYESYFYSLCSIDVAEKLRTMTTASVSA
jgi:hypothetical protein